MKHELNKFRVHSIKTLFLMSLILLVLSGCGEQNTADNQENFSKYTCDNNYDSETISYIQLDINPSFILGVSEDGNVVSIEANNEDGEDVLVNYLGDYFNGVENGVELENVLCDLAAAVKQGGYIEESMEVSVTMLSGDLDEAVLEDAYVQATETIAENEGITASFENNEPVMDEQNDDDNINEDDNKICELCNGEGRITCDLCNGTGTMTEIHEHETEVRNSYVCPYCGGAGILDDGLHGGETAVCGYCGGDGATGPMSGEFMEKAYDKVIVEEEETVNCSRCNGSGMMNCPQCDGTGVVE